MRDQYCVDRYEISLIDPSSQRALSPHYPPEPQLIADLFERYQKTPTRVLTALGRRLEAPFPPALQWQGSFQTQAVSLAGVLPAGYLHRETAARACAQAGKRLCTRQEWVTACRGQYNHPYPYGPSYREGACNIYRNSHPARLLHGDASRHHLDPRLNLAVDADGPLLLKTGSLESCRSTWGEDGIYDMVGNLDEWIAEPSGSFVGGFYSRATRAGCGASIDSHHPAYKDYSLGARCCQDAAPRSAF